MPIFVPSLRRADPARITELVELCCQAVRNSCQGKEANGRLEGVFDNYDGAPALRSVSYIFSAAEEAKMYRENPRNRPRKTTKRPILQEVSGKPFYCPDPILVRHAEIKAFLKALDKAMGEFGFARYQLTPVAIQKAQRTVVPATTLVRTRVTDVVTGELLYMIRAELEWQELPAFAPQPPEEEEA